MFGRFIRDQKAATVIEYALIAAIISLAVLGGAGGIGDALKASYGDTATKVDEVRQRNP